MSPSADVRRRAVAAGQRQLEVQLGEPVARRDVAPAPAAGERAERRAQRRAAARRPARRVDAGVALAVQLARRTRHSSAAQVGGGEVGGLEHRVHQGAERRRRPAGRPSGRRRRAPGRRLRVRRPPATVGRLVRRRRRPSSSFARLGLAAPPARGAGAVRRRGQRASTTCAARPGPAARSNRAAREQRGRRRRGRRRDAGGRSAAPARPRDRRRRRAAQRRRARGVVERVGATRAASAPGSRRPNSSRCSGDAGVFVGRRPPGHHLAPGPGQRDVEQPQVLARVLGLRARAHVRRPSAARPPADVEHARVPSSSCSSGTSGSRGT